MSRPASADSPDDDREADVLAMRRALSARDGEPVALSMATPRPRATAVRGVYRAVNGARS